MDKWEFGLIAVIVLMVVLYLVIELIKINKEVKKRTEKLVEHKRKMVEEYERHIS